ncbi:prepilin peptidase [Allorhizocola rhizosphaerae]|uniref:prepilin peptidase n=1 Tax=Allorhizocola rhizosphaerae TaxID=1872709 RepID=UPI000E3DBA30|nr:A24 family peptidase [Allorhizocola rhizosphaerae]
MGVLVVLAGLSVAPLVRLIIFRWSVDVGQPLRAIPPLRRLLLVGPRVGTVEIVLVGVLGLLAWRVRDPVALVAFAWIAVIGVALAFIDLAVHRLPNALTLSAFLGGAVLLALAGEPRRLGIALLCSLGMTACYLMLSLMNPSGMGLGDGKLALSLGLALGWFGGMVTLYGAVAGFLLAGLYALVMLALGRVTRKDSIAHGPFMLLGALAALVWLPL